MGTRRDGAKEGVLTGEGLGPPGQNSESSGSSPKSCKLYHQFHNLLCSCMTAVKVHFNGKSEQMLRDGKMYRKSTSKLQRLCWEAWGNQSQGDDCVASCFPKQLASFLSPTAINSQKKTHPDRLNIKGLTCSTAQ